MNREQYEQMLRNNLKADKGPACDESEIAEFIRVKFDDFDPREELSRIFMNEEIADYLLRFLTIDDVRRVLDNRLWHQYASINPTFALDTYFRSITVELRNEILDNLVEIYLHSGQERLHRLTSRIRDHYLYGRCKNNLFIE